MEAKYFNRHEFKQALSIINSNPLESKIRFEQYLEKYPKDYCTYTHYAWVLITLGLFDEAEKILDLVESLVAADKKFANNFDKINIIKQDIIINKSRLLGYQKKYDELYKFCTKNYEILDDPDINSTIFYCKKQLGLIDPDRRTPNSYLFRQIVDYQESDFIDHIQKHLADYNMNVDEPNKNIFSADFPINEVIAEIKKHMPSNKRLFAGTYDDTYIFKYNNCGRDNNKSVDYFKVVCFHDTNNMITLCPSSNCECLPYVDLNYLIRNNEVPKVKRLSQAEKFNQRYKRN